MRRSEGGSEKRKAKQRAKQKAKAKSKKQKQKAKSKSKKQIPHTARKGRERVRDDRLGGRAWRGKLPSRKRPTLAKTKPARMGHPTPSEKRKAKSEKQIPHTTRKGRERVRDDSAILQQRVSLEDRYERGDSAILRQRGSLEDRDQRMTVLVLRKVD
jgi:hypothetical protein